MWLRRHEILDVPFLQAETTPALGEGGETPVGVVTGSHAPSFFRSLRAKLVAVTCLLALTISAAIGSISYIRMQSVVLSNAADGLAGEARLVAAKFAESYSVMRRDVTLLAISPEVEGLVRGLVAGGIDPQTGTTAAQWRDALEGVLISFLKQRPAYTQMRFIGLADGGRELVRVNRTATGFERVPASGYQRKGEEPYVKASVASGGVYFSEVTYNREYGKVVLPLQPTLRIVMPVRDAAGQIFGLVVSNADYEQLLTLTFAAVPSAHEATVINSAGDYMRRQPGKKPDALQFHENYTQPPPAILGQFHPEENSEQVYRTDSDLYYFVRLGIAPAQTAASIGVALRVPLSQLLAPAYAFLRDTILVSLLVVAVSLIIAYVIGLAITRRLRTLTETIKGAEGDDDRLVLPEDGVDEVAELSRAFNGLLSEREHLIGKLLISNAELEEFAFAAAHDLKAPLRVIDNASKWLEEEMSDRLTEDNIEDMHLLRSRVTRMEDYLDKLLEFARIGRRENELFRQKVTGSQLLHEVLELLTVPGGFQITASTAFNELTVYLMPLHQVFVNLIGNSIKHHDRAEGSIEIDVEDQGDHYLFSVTDDGPGIPSKYRETIFKMFQTLKPRDQIEGSGMGLAMVKKYVELYGGQVMIDDGLLGRGAIFRFRWPKNQFLR